MSETGIENDTPYASRVAKRTEAGTGLLIAFVLVYIMAVAVVFLDMVMWRPW